MPRFTMTSVLPSLTADGDLNEHGSIAFDHSSVLG